MCVYLSISIFFISFPFLSRYSDKYVRNAVIVFPSFHCVIFDDLAPPNSCVSRGITQYTWAVARRCNHSSL